MATVVRFIAGSAAATVASRRHGVPDDTFKLVNDLIETSDIHAVPETCTR